MDQVLTLVKEYSAVIIAALSALSVILGAALKLSEQLSNDPTTQANGIGDFFRKSAAALRVVEPIVDDALGIATSGLGTTSAQLGKMEADIELASTTQQDPPAQMSITDLAATVANITAQ